MPDIIAYRQDFIIDGHQSECYKTVGNSFDKMATVSNTLVTNTAKIRLF